MAHGVEKSGLKVYKGSARMVHVWGEMDESGQKLRRVKAYCKDVQ